MKTVAIAIDGPAGAGKSTIARAIAAKLGYVYVDTGALYRAVGYAVSAAGGDWHDEATVVGYLPKIDVSLRYVDGAQRVFVNGEDVSDRIRTPEMSMAASAVSALPPVREFLFHLQQDMAVKNNVVMDGRDIGTVVLPHADVKIFLSASAEARAERRRLELLEKGQDVPFDEVLADMKKRDYDDSHRAIAPLRRAEDAVAVDTTTMTLQESVEHVLKLVERVLKEKAV